jgi:hypothetical protein
MREIRVDGKYCNIATVYRSLAADRVPIEVRCWLTPEGSKVTAAATDSIDAMSVMACC